MPDAREDLPGLVVCQQTLQPLERTPDGLWSQAAQRLYPTQGGLVYMGFPERDVAMISATMQEEHDWAGTTKTLDRDAAYLRWSAPRAVKFINLLGRHLRTTRPRTLELGSGSGWVSWLLAQAGHDVYLCDFEANALTLGQVFSHPNMRPGKRIVSDARFAPFPDGSFDVVFFKEFVHHVEDPHALFREANRLLRPEGIVALMEPTMSVVKRLYQLRHPEPHQGHHLTWPARYLRSLSRLGFEPIHVTAMYVDDVPRNRVLRRLKAAAEARTQDARPLDAFGHAHLTVAGRGQLVVVARKRRTVAPAARPRMTVIDPATMTTTAEDCETWGQMLGIVEEAASGLDAPPVALHSG